MPAASRGDTATASRTVTRDRIETFAAVTGDENSLHLDDAYASEGLFAEPVAHGMLTAGIVSSAVAALPGDVVYVSQDMAFEAPVYPGDTVTATAEVSETLEDDRIRVTTTAETEDGTVLTGEAIVLSLEHE